MDPRPLPVRIVAAAAAVLLAVGLPVTLVLLAVLDERWRGLLSTVAVLLIAVPVVLWFVGRRRPAGPEDEG